MKELGMRIKNLRKKMNITQEDLAERLGVSFQAVSKWETSAAYPDLSMLPVLANFFNVTTDELLGVNISRKKEKIDAIIEEYHHLSHLGKYKEKFDLIMSAQREYPNDDRILEKVVWMLCYDPYHDGNGLLAHEEEILSLCNRILNECTKEQLRYTALTVLGGLAKEKGDIDKAIEYANKFPPYYLSKEEGIELSYEEGSDEWWKIVRANIYQLVEMMTVKLRKVAHNADLPPRERIRLFEKAVNFIKMVYEDGDYGFLHNDLCILYQLIANRYIELKEYQKAFFYLDVALNHGKQYDELPKVTNHTSFLVKDHLFERSNVYSCYEGSKVKNELEAIDKNSFYNEVRNMDGFSKIMEKYRPYAKDTKFSS